jgi:hypothetical protein
VKGIVLDSGLRILVEQQRQRLVDFDRSEKAGAPALEAEDARKEFRGRHFVPGRDNGVVEGDGHRRPPAKAMVIQIRHGFQLCSPGGEIA